MEKPFEGVNVCFFCDWWKLPLVQQALVFANPFKKHDCGVQKSSVMFWHKGIDSLNKVRELTRAQRCRDPWLSDFLQGCRNGTQSWSTHCFVHSIPTYECGSWMESEEKLSCGNARCQKLMEETWPAMKREGGWDWTDMQALECDMCKAERERRRRVIRDGNGRHTRAPFVSAPYIHSLNWPKYHAVTLRAIGFAKVGCNQLLWVTAVDWPVTKDDNVVGVEALQRRRKQRLQLHDQKTQGVMGLLPLVKGMAMRCTEITDKEKNIFNNSRGVRAGWRLEQLDEDRVCGDDDAQAVLSIIPEHLCVKVKDADWTVHPSLGKGVYPLKPVYRVWTRDRAENMKVRRFGVPIIPDFVGTAHSYNGATLDAGNGDAGEFH